ncbi:MAG: DUF3347 domain-containing protein [bacterium]|nr:DUF3347 domain-containing protein [bacterium]
MNRSHRVVLGTVALLTALALGRWSASWGEAQTEGHAEHADHSADAQPDVWTCPMHPQIKLPEFGDCPICGMDLVPLAVGEEDGPRRLAMSAASKELARIATRPVELKNVTRPVRMAGKVDYDETTVRTISAWVPGRLDRLFVDYTGVRVAEGDHLVRLYSPSLLTAQEELLSTRARIGATGGEASRFLAASNLRASEAAREKLLLWGLTEAQVDEIVARGTAEDHVVLTSPTSGVVIEKRLDQGAYVETGTPIYRIAELGHLWLLLDAYEQDLPWLRHGQEVVLEVEALPGEKFEGRIAYIDPFLHEHSRTAKVRVNVDNAGGRLKPGMFVSAVAMARIGAGGAVLGRHLAGKWVSPMHPEIVKDAAGSCDICGMDLVPAEELGLVDEQPGEGERPLVVPASAVLATGKRAIVYVEVPGAERPTFEGREIELGPRAGDEYLVLSGLEEGERVVVHGAFRIDSSMQIRAKPSMMSMRAESGTADGPEALVFRASLQPLYAAYLALQTALAADDEAAARAALAALRSALATPAAGGLAEPHRSSWRTSSTALVQATERAEAADETEGLRAAFEGLSMGMLEVARTFGHDGSEVLHEAHCPMAFDFRGASWLQVGDVIANPYFGDAMLRCGEVREAFAPAGGQGSADPHAGHVHEPADEDQ